MAAVRSLSEGEAAAWAAAQGRKVARHRAHHWEQVRPGFYQPVHLLGALGEGDVSRPAPVCWGYRAVVGSEAADSCLRIYLVDDLAGYDEGALASKRRGTLRRVQRSSLRIVALDDDALLRREGYGVCVSAYERFGFASLPTREEYVRRLARQQVGERSSALAAIDDGRLVGYILAHVIERTGYGEDFHVHSDALRTNASTALVFEMLQLLRSSGVVDRVWNGVVDAGNEGLHSFKQSMGFAPTALPTRVRMWPGAEALLRRRWPQRYERLTGKPAA